MKRHRRRRANIAHKREIELNHFVRKAIVVAITARLLAQKLTELKNKFPKGGITNDKPIGSDSEPIIPK